jgi:hypothetical protein
MRVIEANNRSITLRMANADAVIMERIMARVIHAGRKEGLVRRKDYEVAQTLAFELIHALDPFHGRREEKRRARRVKLGVDAGY